MSGHGHGYGYGRQREARRRRLLARLVETVDEMLAEIEQQTVAASRAGRLRPSSGCEGCSCCEVCGTAPGTVGTNGAGALCRACWRRWAAGRVEIEEERMDSGSGDGGRRWRVVDLDGFVGFAWTVGLLDERFGDVDPVDAGEAAELLANGLDLGLVAVDEEVDGVVAPSCGGCGRPELARHPGCVRTGLALVDALAPDVLPVEIAVEEEGDGAER